MATRFIALDIHRDYFMAGGVDSDKEIVLQPRRVANAELDDWIKANLTSDDAVVIEMTVNTYRFYDALLPQVGSVTVVHPPHVALITRAQVKTDRRAVLTLANLHAAGLLPGVWIPPQEVRELRALVAQRRKMVRLATTAKNRLHSALFRHALPAPQTRLPFSPKRREFWLSLPVPAMEQVNILCDWETVEFAERQKKLLEGGMAKMAAEDARIPLLVQLPGVGMVGAVTLLAAIGDIRRFESDKKLVGYSGLGARVHDSGQMHTTGRITKAGRKDIRYTMVEAARKAARTHPHWKREFARLEARIGSRKAYVAIARKLLIAVWHVLTEECADRFADPQRVAASLFAHAYDLTIPNLPGGQSARQYTRDQLDRLRLGAKLASIPWGRKRVNLPPSKLTG